MTSHRICDRFGPLALFCAIVGGSMLLYSCVAHAAGVGPAEAPEPATLTVFGLPWQSWAVIALGALALVRTIVDAALAFFKAEAPLTATTVDDRIRDSLQAAHDKLDKLAGTVNVLVDASKPPGGVPVLSVAPRNPQAGRARLVTIVAIAVIGSALAGMAMIGCTKAELGAAATSGEHAVINCTGMALGSTPALDIATLVAIANTVVAERAKCSPSGGSLDWSCVEADAIREGEVLGGCSLVQLLASSTAAATAVTAARTAGPPDSGHVALEDFRSRFAGGAAFHTSAGDY